MNMKTIYICALELISYTEQAPIIVGFCDSFNDLSKAIFDKAGLQITPADLEIAFDSEQPPKFGDYYLIAVAANVPENAEEMHIPCAIPKKSFLEGKVPDSSAPDFSDRKMHLTHVGNCYLKVREDPNLAWFALAAEMFHISGVPDFFVSDNLLKKTMDPNNPVYANWDPVKMTSETESDFYQVFRLHQIPALEKNLGDLVANNSQ